MTTFAPTLDTALAGLVSIGSQARAEYEDGHSEIPATVAAIATAFNVAERAGATEDEANAAYREGFDWGER